MEAIYEPIKIGNPKVFIVGMSPNTQRKTQKTRKVWEGNRSGDLMQKAIQGLTDLYLTNISNVYSTEELTPEMIASGLDNLANDIIKYEPVKILLFGEFAQKKFKKFFKTREEINNAEVISLLHPSYIVRFNKDQKRWIDDVRSKIQINVNQI
jgi:uracil-DNA glycosylase